MENYKSNIHFDYDKLMERLDYDTELIDQLLVLTKEYLKDFMPIMDKLIAEKNISAIKSHIHKMKGTALSVCFESMVNQTQTLEMMEHYDDESYLKIKSNLIIEIDYLINMIDNKAKVFTV